MTWLCDLLQCDRRQAYHTLIAKSFRVGTDRRAWIDIDHARKFLDTLPPL